MSGFLFEHVIFGPVRSRRLGISLGVNLMPLNRKVCTFNCLYCECGWTEGGMERGREGEMGPCRGSGFPAREAVREEMERRLSGMAAKNDMITNITFAGNGEPTLHPDFPAIVDDTLRLRDKYFPRAGVSVLSNASLLHSEAIIYALLKVDQSILKLDAGTEQTFHRINNPRVEVSLEAIVDNLMRFEGKIIIQSLFVKGSYQGEAFDNTTDEEVDAWLGHLVRIRPQLVMIYPIARATPTEDVQKIPSGKLMEIAARVEALGIATEVFG